MTEEISEVMRILEESAQTDTTTRIVNGTHGLNLTEMTFHEITKKISQLLGGGGEAGASQQLVHHLVQLSYKVAEGFEGQTRTELLEAGNELDRVGRATLP